jgi:hypothetical protein
MRTPSSQKCRLDLAPPWADRFISGITPSITARYFSAGPSDAILRYSLDGHPALRSTASGGFRSVLACVQLSPSCPFRRLHTFRFLRPARLRTPLLGYGAPHLSARGTSTLLNNALLSAHFPFADHPGVEQLRSTLRHFSIASGCLAQTTERLVALVYANSHAGE